MQSFKNSVAVRQARESETAAYRALSLAHELTDRFQEALSLRSLAFTLGTRGVTVESETAILRSERISQATSDKQATGNEEAYRVQLALWSQNPGAARSLANNAWHLAHVLNYERDFIQAARLQGEVALGLNDFVSADERLLHALTRARKVNFVEEELLALVALADLRRRQRDVKAARELLDDAWELAERGPYPLFHSDAFNVLAQIERDRGNTEAAIEAATKAYRLAWCNGPPFAYHWGLEKAKQHLKELGAPVPEMPPFDESKFEPMPEVEIDPDDEFHVGNSSEEG
ncbi:MAG TPA: hypothetical protein VK582_18610 [Pyrinomonadaceae bacterium]|nr:hypothetical protein [Pyrinomonadaceae bacterium]